MIGELQINGKRVGTVTDMQMPEFNRSNVDRLRDERDNIFRNMEASTNVSERRSLNWAWNIKQVQLSAFELAKPEDNTPEKLAERAACYEQ